MKFMLNRHLGSDDTIGTVLNKLPSVDVLVHVHMHYKIIQKPQVKFLHFRSSLRVSIM